jgi:DNA gyrase/topoisomerase IV subunit B
MSDQKVQFLSPIQHVQLRSSMYVGDTSNPRTLVKEVCDNATDEILNGYGNRVALTLDPINATYMCQDNGRGLPLYKVKDHDNKRAAQLLFTELFSGGKFQSGTNYKYSSGLHGIGLSVVNALSDEVLVAVNSRENGYYSLHLRNGEVETESFDSYKDNVWWTTEVAFKPSPKYFKSLRTGLDTLSLSLARKLNPGTSITINGKEVEPFQFKTLIGEKFLGDTTFRTKVEKGNIIFDVHYGWSATEFNYVSKGAVNLVPVHVGWHERKARAFISQALADQSTLISPQDASYGLRVFVNLFSQKPMFSSQTKERLSSIDDEPDGFEKVILQKLTSDLTKDDSTLQLIVKKIVAYKTQLEKLSDTDFINSVVRKGTDKRSQQGVGLSVWDCTSRMRNECELYVVEGRSAAGHLRNTRDTRTQAVLPLRGKPLNAVAKDDIKTILGNEEMIALVNTIGAGITPGVDLKAMRYGKIIIASDADPDGCQISNLVLGALVYLVPEIVEAGHVYEVVAPLYYQDGKFLYSLEEVNTRKRFERYKGLGSMNQIEVKDTIISPKTRLLRQITLDDRSVVLDILQLSSEKKRIMIEGGVLIELRS